MGNLCLPSQGKASSYSDYVSDKHTSSGDVYLHRVYTAAIMPKSRWYCVPMGTLVKVTSQGRSVVVKINDRGAGDKSAERVLDLSRAAMSALVGWDLKSDRDAFKAGLITLDKIEVVSASTLTGFVR